MPTWGYDSGDPSHNGWTQQHSGIGAYGYIDPSQAATHMGGFNNPMGDPGYLENKQDQRLQGLGNQPIQNLPWWQQQQAQEFGQWSQESAKQQQALYAQAQGLAQGGANTRGAQALAAQQMNQNAAMGAMAAGAGGGARGAASAAATQQQGLGQNAGMQAYQMGMQNLADKAAGAQLMGQIANQQRGLQQGQFNFQGEQAANLANYQQGWNGLNDQADLFGNTMQANRMAADLGFQNQSNNLALQQQIQAGANQQQLLGAGASAVGAGFAGASRDGGSGNGQPQQWTGSAQDQQQWQDVYNSDESLKEPLGDSSEIEDRFLSTLAKSKAVYSYTDPKYEPGFKGGEKQPAYLGVMAQDLEEIPHLGRQLVGDHPEGHKVVSVPAMVSALSAGLGRIAERLDKVEKRRAVR